MKNENILKIKCYLKFNYLFEKIKKNFEIKNIIVNQNCCLSFKF